MPAPAPARSTSKGPAKIELRPMAEEEYRAWLAAAMPSFAREKVKNGTWKAAEAKELSRQAFQQLLPQGSKTPEQHLFVIQFKAAKRVIGYLWYAAKAGRAFLFDIVIQPSARGQGYGRQAMQCLEVHARQQGLEAIELHVFGHNEVTRSLYADLGYAITDLSMRKWLKIEAPKNGIK